MPDSADDASEASLQVMYLKQLRLEGFRSCADVVIPLQSSITLLVGENNAGKSNVIDALRLATLPLSGRRTRYFNPDDDVTLGLTGPITLTTKYAGMSKYQRAQYIGALDVNAEEVVFSTRYFVPDSDKNLRGRVENLSGPAGTADAESDKRDQINHVYLEPLRDAQRELDSASAGRLALIMKHLVDPDQQEEFVEQARVSFRQLSEHAAVTATNTGIQSHLSGLTDGVRGQKVGMSFDPPELHRLTRSLRLKMAERGVDLADIAASGLGYANLLFLATVILELQKAKTAELTLFLVEEPEAHLHPQLQAVLLDYLQEQAEKSVVDDSEGPAGRIQIIATTHSPNLASAVGTKNVVILRSMPHTSDATTGSATKQTAALCLADLPLAPDDRRKIDQYLDATKSELLFSRRVILVEGVSEAVLLPAIAKHCVFSGATPADDQSRRTFRGTSIINIGMVDFAPYLRLMLTEQNGIRMVDRLVVITDGDPVLPADQADDGSDDGEAVEPYNRAFALRAIGDDLAAGAVLHVAEAPHTLEADLLVDGSDNHILLGEALLQQRPRSAAKWATIVAAEQPAQALYEKLRKTSTFISKGQFAHDVAQRIADGGSFTCPEYLAEAIRLIVASEEAR